MTLSIQSLHTQVTQLAANHSDATTGKLRGGVAAHTQGHFQGLQVSNGARDSEKAFAAEVLKHVSNITLNRNDKAELLKGSTNNFELRRAGHGESRLVGLKSDQLTLRDAKILLDAVMRQQGPAPVPSRGHQQSAPPLPPRIHQQSAPPLPPRIHQQVSVGSLDNGGDKKNPSKYDQQFIIDSGSGRSAEGLMVKANSNGLPTQSVSFAKNGGNIADNLKGITFNSRVYIIGHCSPGSSEIVSDNNVRITVKDYAKGIAEALTQSKAEYKGAPLTVSVMACNGGSSSSVLVNNRNEALALRADNEHVDIVWPSSRGGYGFLPVGENDLNGALKIKNLDQGTLHDSFAEKLTNELSKLGIVTEVKGRTNVVTRTSERFLEKVRDGSEEFSKKVKKRHHVEGDKVVFTPESGGVNKSVHKY